MTEDQIVEIGARAHFDFEARRRYGRRAPTWDRSLTAADRAVAQSAFAAALAALSEAGLAIVPVEPSEWMLNDATNYTPEGHDLARAIYRVMVRAAAKES